MADSPSPAHRRINRHTLKPDSLRDSAQLREATASFKAYAIAEPACTAFFRSSVGARAYAFPSIGGHSLLFPTASKGQMPGPYRLFQA